MAPRRATDLASLGDEAFTCHFYRRHAFPLPDWFEAEFMGLAAWKTRLVCPNCGSVKIVYCEPDTMVVWSVQYQHEDGYLLETGPAAGTDLLKESLERSLDRQRGQGAQVRSLRGRAQRARGA